MLVEFSFFCLFLIVLIINTNSINNSVMGFIYILIIGVNMHINISKNKTIHMFIINFLVLLNSFILFIISPAVIFYSTVTLFARFLGLSISQPLNFATS